MRDIVLTALAPLAWGTTYFVTTRLLPPNRPLLVGLIRALPVGLLLMAFSRKLPSGKWWWQSLVLGVLNIGLFFWLLFVAAYRLPGGVVAMLMAIQPLQVALLGWAILAEHPGLHTFIASGFGLLGVGLIVLGPTARFGTVGVVTGIAATLAMASGTVLTKRWGCSVPLLVFTSWQLVAGGLVLLPFAFAIEGSPPTLSTKNLLGFAWLGVPGTGIAYALWFRDFKHLIKSLADTPENVRRLVENLTADELQWQPATAGFSCLEHVCHLRDIEREGYAIRISKLLREQHPFLPDIDGDKLARERNYNDQSLELTLDEFSQARERNVSTISDLSTDQLKRIGAFENVGPITLEELLLMMRQHDEEHLCELCDLRSQLIKRRILRELSD